MIRAILSILVLCCLFMAAPGLQAQTAVWESVASRAEKAVDDRSDSSAVFETLRGRIVGFREDFDTARKQNEGRIATLREQLAALGPAPGEEAAEPEAQDVAERRDELETQLAALLAPVQVAEAAFRRADGLIGEIDQILRDRQTEELLSLGPSPLNPAYWGDAITETRDAIGGVMAARTSQNRENRNQILHDKLPLVLALFAGGMVLILRGRRWSSRIVNTLSRMGARGFGIWRFVVSLLRIVLPFFGLVLLSQAAIRTGLFGTRGNELLEILPLAGGFILGIRWVSERVFSRDEDEALIQLPPERRAELRFYIGGITLLILLEIIADHVLDQRDVSASTHAVVMFPLTTLMGLLLFRVGQVLRGYRDEPANPDEEEARPSGLRRIVRTAGLAAIGVAVVGVVMAAVGYANAADALIGPYTLSLIILALVMVLQRFAADIYGAVTGQGEAARDALIPVLFGFALTVCAMPVLALVWGARMTDLAEIWASFSRGFAIGETRISPVDFLTFAVIFAIGYILTRLVQGALRTNVLPKTQIDIGGQNAIVSGLGYVGIFIAALIAITGAGIDLSSLAIVAGALSVGIGFGLQNIVSNFVSGIILLIERPISEGDWIEVGGQMGYVRDISVRSTRIETFDRSDVIVPNADLVSGTVTNYTRGNTIGRLIISVGVAYGTDTRKVDTILREIAEAQPLIIGNPPPSVLFMGFGADSLDFEIRAILRDVNYMMSVRNDINHEIAARFAEEGIEMPFAQRDIWLRNPEALGQATAPKTGDTSA